MSEFEALLGLLLAALVLAALARRVGVPYPAFLALGGAVLAFLPGAPVFAIEPRLALALFVAPVLLDAAFDASPRDLKDTWVPLLSLVVGGVALTTVVGRRSRPHPRAGDAVGRRRSRWAPSSRRPTPPQPRQSCGTSSRRTGF